MSEPNVRRSIEEAIETLVALLDTIDPDPDLEDVGDNEPLLGWPDALPGRGVERRLEGSTDGDRKQDDCDLEDGHDAEPEPLEPNIAGWLGSTDDVEDDTAHYDFPGFVGGGQGA